MCVLCKYPSLMQVFWSLGWHCLISCHSSLNSPGFRHHILAQICRGHVFLCYGTGNQW
jgi:hypothetical protein